jgi:glycosyltransferase involved in cell wall biosynthesis
MIAAPSLRVGIVVPHIFMHGDILPKVIFSPGQLALDLAGGLQELGTEVTLFTPGPVDTKATNITADLSLFEQELAARGDSYIDLLKKHPLTFITLGRQVQSELLAKAYAAANADKLDVVHVYTNEEDTALPFAQFCRKPVVFTHHDPYNFLVKYRSLFPKYPRLNWLSISLAQRKGMPQNTNWVGNIYHGLEADLFKPNYHPQGGYIAYLGRIIEPKGVHLAIAAIKEYNKQSPDKPLKLKIAGKHYTGQKDSYWQKLQPLLADQHIEYVGFIKDTASKQDFLGNAAALIVPSTFQEPFGMVMIEALACATPLIGLNSGAIPEVIDNSQTGILVKKSPHDAKTVAGLCQAIYDIQSAERSICRQYFERNFTLSRMCQEHLTIYKKLAYQS